MEAYLPLILLIALSAIYLRLAMNILGEEIPGFGKALVITPVVAITGFVTFSTLSFLVVLAITDGGKVGMVPTYTNWLHTSFQEKYKVLGQVPFIRYPAIMVTLAVMGIVQTLSLTIPFRRAMLVFGIQWMLAFFSLYLIHKGLELLPVFNR